MGIIFGSVLYAVAVNDTKTQIVLRANADYYEDPIAEEMNNWYDTYCDNAPECYGGPNDTPSKGLTFGNRYNFRDNIKYKVPPYNTKWSLVDLDKLAYAVSMHESKGCNSFVARYYNNCFGIRRGGKWQGYTTQQDSFDDFKDIWRKYYGGFPTLEMAERYSGKDRAEAWLNNVTYYYNKAI